MVAIAAGHDHVGLAPVDGCDELGDRLRRVLEVAVHDDGHPALAQSEPGYHRPTETTGSLPRLAVQHQDGDGGGIRYRGNHLGGVVTTVVDEDHL